MTVSAGRKELSSKVDGFYYTKNSFPIAGMRDLLKNTFALDGKKAYGLYLPENPFPLPGMKHSLIKTFSQAGKKLIVKTDYS